MMKRLAPVAALRALRSANSRIVAAALQRWPPLEPAFIRIGRWLTARSHVLGTLYWFAQEELLAGLRRSGRRFRTVSVAGGPQAVDVTHGTGRFHYFHDQLYEPALTRAIAACLQPGDVFVDVGANVGFFSILAARLVGPAGRVVAFEPNPATVSLLERALAVNGAASIVEIVHAAAADGNGTTALFLADDALLSTTDPARSPGDQVFRESIAVPQVSLDRWFTDHPDLLARLRAIKIDVEGTELEVLAGMTGVLEHAPGAIVFCETSGGSEADRWLKARGYIAVALERVTHSVGNYRYERR